MVTVGLVCFLVVGGRLCHLGSDRLSSLSDLPCQLEDFSSSFPRGVREFILYGMNPPLYFSTSYLPLIFCVLFVWLTRWIELSDGTVVFSVEIVV